MNEMVHRFRIGSFDGSAIYDGLDGSMPAPDTAQFLFKNAPQKALAAALRSHHFPLDQWTESFTCLVVKTGRHSVLLDTGLGTSQDNPGAGLLLKNLRSAGFDPDEIDTVLLSHAHGDHIGGIMGPDGHPNFPHAQYFLRKEDWDFWTSETTLADPAHYWMAEFIEKKLKPVQAELHLLEQDREIVPGIQTLFTPGHTPGNLSFIIKSGEEQLMYLGDVFLHPIHIEHPTWTSEVDILPRKNGQARRKLLEWAACEQALVFATHFDFPSLGHILRRDKKYLWRPIKRAW